jgi:hypothetical protein
LRRRPKAINYEVAQHVRIMPLTKTRVEKIIALDPGELFTGVAIWDIPIGRKETFTLRAEHFDEMLHKVLDFLRSEVTAKTYIVCEMTFIQHPSATFVWQIIGAVRYFYREQLCAVPPSQANKGAYGYGKPKLSEKKKVLRERGWAGFKSDHEVAAATLAEFFYTKFVASIFT